MRPWSGPLRPLKALVVIEGLTGFQKALDGSGMGGWGENLAGLLTSSQGPGAF